ncbi:protein ANTAGONIST OF LIKE HETEROCHROMATIN PROTEIN 1 [Tachysurus fulvidraco]|uniref:protein ANTAGONIST OF LIKE HETEROCHROMATIN PROTEIN 1 n=1 Tax=Tachysurus fulvidraco TaxID=1234273 RepID=UPI001FEDFB15|nr:protein ANTAGONIST OF LIKE HETEROCHROMATIN PROTEIN 1 [Tachysurus fulvidraco]XP_047664008.1 protein ANTAGONIST OF LIKE HETEROCHROMATIN PROTEIN 1 [Tachysurus fulvidraco]
MADSVVHFMLVAYILIQNKLIHRVCAAQSSLYKRRVHSRIRAILWLKARRRSPAIWAYPRSEHWWQTIVPDFTPQQFLLNFRMAPETFEYICSRVKHVMERRNTNFRLCVSSRKRVAIAIWKLATGSEYRTISHLFGVGLSTVFNCVQEFCNAVITMLLPYHIRFPDADKLLEMSTFFNNRWRVPQCVGAIDGTHIPIIAPEDRPQDYYNRKGWHSVVLQAVVDGKGLLWDVCVGYPGSVHDARVLRQSHLWEVLSDGELLGQTKVTISGYDLGYYLIGDPAIPMQKWLMKPFSDTGRLTPEQHTYNYRLSSAWSVVEMSFGRLKGRWRCLLKRNDCKVELCKTMAVTCCVLHNICEEHGDNFTEEHTNRTENIQPPVQAVPEHGNTEGADTRAALMMHFNRESY